VAAIDSSSFPHLSTSDALSCLDNHLINAFHSDDWADDDREWQVWLQLDKFPIETFFLSNNKALT